MQISLLLSVLLGLKIAVGLIATCETQFSQLEHSVTNVSCPSGCLKESDSCELVCGCQDFNEGSICLAAIRDGLIENSGGRVRVFQHHFAESTTPACPITQVSYSFQMSCTTTGNIEGDVTTVTCPVGCTNDFICGNEIYSGNLSLCAAAIHAGKIGDQGGKVTVHKDTTHRICITQSVSNISMSEICNPSIVFSFNESHLNTSSTIGPAPILKKNCEDDGWLVFQRRFDGSVDFNKNWEKYEFGFGNTGGEFWWGLENVHQAIQGRSCRLRIELQTFSKEFAYAEYSNFEVSSKGKDYILTTSGYSGTAGDSLAYVNNMKFTTKDNDNDLFYQNCANVFAGGFWFRNCFDANLNGVWGVSTGPSENIVWSSWKGFGVAMEATLMMFRCD